MTLSYRLGEGSYGTVFADDSGTVVAKMMTDHAYYISECLALRRVAGCPFIVPLLGTNIRNMALFMPMARGNMSQEWTYSYRCQPMREALVRAWSWQLMRAVAHAHERGVVHRDIKGCNVLIGKNGSLLLADWNSSCFVKNVGAGTASCTITTRPPETMGSAARPHDTKGDVWSAAMTLCQIFGARHRRSFLWTESSELCNQSESVTMMRIGQALGVPDSFGWGKDLFPSRPDKSRVLKQLLGRHSFPEKWGSWMLDCFLHADPRCRTSAADSLLHPYFRGCDDRWSMGVCEMYSWNVARMEFSVLHNPTRIVMKSVDSRPQPKARVVESVFERVLEKWAPKGSWNYCTVALCLQEAFTPAVDDPEISDSEWLEALQYLAARDWEMPDWSKSGELTNAEQSPGAEPAETAVAGSPAADQG